MRSGEACQYTPVSVDEEKIVARAFERYEARYPESFRKSSDYLKSHLHEDLRYHVRYMKESLAIDDPIIFLDYVSWLQVHFTWLHFPGDVLEATLDVFSEVLLEVLPEEKGEKVNQYIARARALLSGPSQEIPSYIQVDNPLAAPARAYLAALLATNQEEARVILMEQLDRGISVRDLYRSLFQPVLQEAGRLWQIQQVSVAQEHYITEVTRLFIALLNERLNRESRKQKRKGRLLVATCVSDELHDVGIRMVTNFFEMDGWDTLYTGANTPAPSVVAMIQDRHADAIAISSTMPFHISRVYELIRAIRANPRTAGTRIIVGGYPFHLVPGLWKCLGADAGALSADEAVEKVNRLISS